MSEVSAMLGIRWSLITLGLIYFVTESAIFMHPRLWIAKRGTWAMLFVYCASCTGFWVGAASSYWLWPFDMLGDTFWFRYVEGGVAAMALGAIWKSLNGGNPAFEVEAELLTDDDSQPEKEEPTNAQG